MELDHTQLRKLARAAKSAEELQKLGVDHSAALTEEQAQDLFDKLNRTGALSDEELDNVAGGCGISSQDRETQGGGRM